MSTVLLDPIWVGVEPGELNHPPDDLDETRAEAAETFEAVPSAETPDFSRDALSALIDQWVERVVSHARTREIDGAFVVDVVGIDGPWASGSTKQAAKAEFADVLAEWVRLKLEDGDDDIPPMEGLHLVIER